MKGKGTIDRQTALLRNSVFRQPSWRWTLAVQAVERGEAPTSIADGWISHACAFLNSPPSAPNPVNTPSNRRWNSAIAQAALIAGDDSAVLWYLQGLLLTKVSLAEVGRRCSLTVATVRTFHALFYCVREHFNARDWISLRAVGCGPWNQFGGPQPGGIWRFAAYCGGPLLLDVVRAAMLNLAFPESIQTLFCDAPQEIRLRLKVKLTVAILTARSPEALAEVVKLQVLADRLDRQMGTGHGPEDPILKLMTRFLTRLAQPRWRSRQRKSLSPHNPVGAGTTQSADRVFDEFSSIHLDGAITT